MADTISAANSAAGTTVYEQLGLKDKEVYTGKETTTREAVKELDKDAFLQLMITKLQNQDPLAPTDDTQFLAQLAQFTTLEQMTNLAATTELSQGFSMVGKYVSVKLGEEEIIAKIDSAVANGGSVQFNIGGYLFSMDDILEVIDPDTLEIVGPNKPETPENGGNIGEVEDSEEPSVEESDSDFAEAVLSAQEIAQVADLYNLMAIDDLN